MKKILQFGTYPITNRQHGGQKRTGAIHDAYAKRFDVRYVAVFSPSSYFDYNKKWDVPLSRRSTEEANNNPLTGDIICGRAIYEDEEVKGAVTERLLRFKPDIIQVEQPYIYIGLKPLLKELRLSPKIIFSSHNVEGPMKREMLVAVGMSKTYIEKAVRVIDQTEKYLAEDSALVTACTDADLRVHESHGAKKCVLAMNGISPIVAPERSLQHWRNVFRKENVNRLALFVASAHPPSITGFMDMIGKGVGFVGRDERIVLAGGICSYFVDMFKPSNVDIGDATFWLRAYSAGRLSEDRLCALLMLADVILLPITEGGGSNLKTAEAIIADKKIVTTSHALRSFEWLVDFPNVWVADTEDEFKRAIRDAFNTPQKTRTEKQKQQANTVLWDYRLRDLVAKVEEL